MSELKQLPPGWKWAKLGDKIRTITPPFKFPKTQFGTEGKFPIIDQSQNEIAGWTDDESVLVKHFPVVVFGDHTCCIKYLSSPFAQGADGIKIIATADELLPKFLYYWLQQSPLSFGGYRRHFGELKRLDISLPSLSKQQQIITILDRQMPAVGNVRVAAEEKMLAVRLLPSALLREVFRYSENDKLPDGWHWTKLDEVMTINFGTRITRHNDAGEKYPVYGGGGESFRTDTYNREDEYVVSRFAMSQKCVRFVKGKFFMLDSGFTFSVSAANEKNVSKEFIALFLLSAQLQLYDMARGQAQRNLDMNEFRQISIPLPPLPEQKRIVSLLNRQLVVAKKAQQAAEEELQAINALPSALLRQVFAVE